MIADVPRAPQNPWLDFICGLLRKDEGHREDNTSLLWYAFVDDSSSPRLPTILLELRNSKLPRVEYSRDSIDGNKIDPEEFYIGSIDQSTTSKSSILQQLPKKEKPYPLDPKLYNRGIGEQRPTYQVSPGIRLSSKSYHSDIGNHYPDKQHRAYFPVPAQQCGQIYPGYGELHYGTAQQYGQGVFYSGHGASQYSFQTVPSYPQQYPLIPPSPHASPPMSNLNAPNPVDFPYPHTPVKQSNCNSLVSPQKPTLPTVEGWLLKRGPRHGMVWRLRFCRLKGRTLTYYAREDMKTKKGEIILDNRTRIRAFSDRTCSQQGRTLVSTHPMGFEIFRGHAERCYLFDAWTHEKLMVWMHGLILHWSHYRDSPRVAVASLDFGLQLNRYQSDDDDDEQSAVVFNAFEPSNPSEEGGTLREFPSGWGLERSSPDASLSPTLDAEPKKSFFRSIARSVKLN